MKSNNLKKHKIVASIPYPHRIPVFSAASCRVRKWTRRGLLLLAAHATFCTGGIQLWDKGCPLQNCPLELKDFFHRTSPISTLRESSPTQKQKGQDLFLSLSSHSPHPPPQAPSSITGEERRFRHKRKGCKHCGKFQNKWI
jgi:hypothetical protein